MILVNSVDPKTIARSYERSCLFNTIKHTRINSKLETKQTQKAQYVIRLIGLTKNLTQPSGEEAKMFDTRLKPTNTL